MSWIMSNPATGCALRSPCHLELLPWDTFRGGEQGSYATSHWTDSSCFQHLHQWEMSCIPSTLCCRSLNHLYKRDVAVQENKRGCKRKNAVTEASKWQLKTFSLKEEAGESGLMKSPFLKLCEETPLVPALVLEARIVTWYHHCHSTTDRPLLTVKRTVGWRFWFKDCLLALRHFPRHKGY